MRELQADQVQLSTDGLGAYLLAVEDAFGAGVDFTQLVKSHRADGTVYTDKRTISGTPDPLMASTSNVERANLTTRMSVRRYNRRTNAFSKKLENHRHMVAICMVWYNSVRVHSSLGTTPAVAAGLYDEVLDMAWMER